MDTRKQAILETLRKFIAQRPGLESANYGDVSAYRSEMRSITKDRHHAETLLNAVAWRDSITADDLIKASQHTFSGRLTIRDISAHNNDGSTYHKFAVHYCAGQYFPTEYRRAVCAVMASALWDYWRSDIPESVESKGDYLRDMGRKEFGRSIGSRWFN